ncbi:MAG: ATP-binding cassette domain-containing protein [Proteobacteria bacterium]|nr:MAG: ATP-binding cassette domain-containing protein [Pseudomonadota bacterium]
MALFTLDGISLAFGDHIILKRANFVLDPGERVCLIGRNGAGKTSLLKLITGKLEPDDGEIQFSTGIQISQLDQALPSVTDMTVYEFVAVGLGEQRNLIDLYTERSSGELDNTGLAELEALQRRIDAHGGWNIDQQVKTVLSELNLPGSRRLDELSGGWQRRVGLAQALVCNPDLLLLDEPTNHLDLTTIEWLEKRVLGFRGSVMFITHDRAFLQRLATRIVEIDRGKLRSWPGDYRTYLRDKDRLVEEEARSDSVFDKKLAAEETWIRQGIKARRTRNEGRVRALQAMRAVHAARIKPDAKARIHVEEAERSGRKVIEARNISYRYGDEPLIEKMSIKIMRGDRIGLIGNNGVGKSTLLRILIGELAPLSGTIKLGTNLEIGYFDQLREQLDPDKTVAEIVGDGRDYIKINGKERHVIGYLKGFLFSAKRAMTPVRSLSGGECNRIILARLFTRPTNFLVLDEPTNDLDIETLEVLEDRLVDYSGTLIVVSHDREFLDNVITKTLVFESAGRIGQYVGGYTDWLRQGNILTEVDTPTQKKTTTIRNRSTTRNGAATNKKLTFKLKHELEQLPERIDTLERELSTLHGQTITPGFYARAFTERQPIMQRLSAVQSDLDSAIERWTELESRQNTREQ